MKNGLAVARYLENHPCVERVIHPGNFPCFPLLSSAQHNKINKNSSTTHFFKDCHRIRNMNLPSDSATVIAE